jgi:hypothetical protein
MAAWYGTAQITVSPEGQEVAASLLWLLKGNAAQRIVAAWHMRWGPALEASGRGWQAPLLAPLLRDPYGVVRYVAHRSLEQVMQRPVMYDFVGQPARWETAVEDVRRWSGQGGATAVQPERRTAVFQRPDGQVDWDRIERLTRQRDDTPISIKE